MQSLYVMRHGQAEPGANKADEDRLLTPAGRMELQATLLGLRRAGVRFDKVLSSPLRRTMQTAEIVGERPPKELMALAAGAAEATMHQALVQQVDDAATTLVVGHMPDVAALVLYLTSKDAAGPGLPFRPGAMAWLQWDGNLRPGDAVMRWFLQPDELARLGL